MSANLRIGHGFDVHAFEDGDAIILGGVSIPHGRAFRAHSDGDVLLHALCDAILGALAMGDIGRHFPDTDARYHNMDSRFFLREVAVLARGQGYRLANADVTIIAQAPRISPHCQGMIDNICADLACSPSVVNIKATTTERLGYTGREEGIAVHAVVLLERDS